MQLHNNGAVSNSGLLSYRYIGTYQINDVSYYSISQISCLLILENWWLFVCESTPHPGLCVDRHMPIQLYVE